MNSKLLLIKDKMSKQKIGKATEPTKLAVVSPSLDKILMYNINGKKIAERDFSKKNAWVTDFQSVYLGRRKILCASATRRNTNGVDEYKAFLFNERLEEIAQYPLSSNKLVITKYKVKQKECLAIMIKKDYNKEVIFIDRDCKPVCEPIKFHGCSDLTTVRRDNIGILVGESFKYSCLISPDSRKVQDIEHRESWHSVAAPVHGEFIYCLWGPGDPGYGMDIKVFDWKLRIRGNRITESLGIFHGHQWKLSAIDFKNRSYVALRTDETIHVLTPDLEKRVLEIKCDYNSPHEWMSVEEYARKQYLFVHQGGRKTAVYNERMKCCGEIPIGHIPGSGDYIVSLNNTKFITGQIEKGMYSIGRLEFHKNNIKFLPIATLGTEKDRYRIRNIRSFKGYFRKHISQMLATENHHDHRIQLYKYIGGTFYKGTFLRGNRLQII